MNELPLRPNVCILLCNRDGKLFLGERNGEPGIWQFPQGGVEPDCSLEENVLRELNEEVGVDRRQLRIIKKLNATHSYNFSNTPKYAEGRWRGQSQTFWLVEFTGKDTCIKLDTHEQEFRDWRWCTVEEVRTLAEPKRMVGYRPALEEFEAYLRQR